MNHGRVNEGFAGLSQIFIIFAQASKLANPGKGSFHNPTTWHNLKALTTFRAISDFDHPSQLIQHPLRKWFTVISTIHPHFFHAVKIRFEGQYRLLGSFPVSGIGGSDFDFQQQAIGVDKDVTFASFDLFTAVKATFAPFSVVFTD